MIVITVQLENIKRVVARYRAHTDDEGNYKLLEKAYFTFTPDGGIEAHNLPPRKEPLWPDQVPEDQRKHIDWGGRKGGRYTLLRKLVKKLAPGAKDRIQKLSRYQPLPAYDDPKNPAWLMLKAIVQK